MKEQSLSTVSKAFALIGPQTITQNTEKKKQPNFHTRTSYQVPILYHIQYQPSSFEFFVSAVIIPK